MFQGLIGAILLHFRIQVFNNNNCLEDRLPKLIIYLCDIRLLVGSINLLLLEDERLAVLFTRLSPEYPLRNCVVRERRPAGAVCQGRPFSSYLRRFSQFAS